MSVNNLIISVPTHISFLVYSFEQKDVLLIDNDFFSSTLVELKTEESFPLPLRSSMKDSSSSSMFCFLSIVSFLDIEESSLRKKSHRMLKTKDNRE